MGVVGDVEDPGATAVFHDLETTRIANRPRGLRNRPLGQWTTGLTDGHCGRGRIDGIHGRVGEFKRSTLSVTAFDPKLRGAMAEVARRDQERRREFSGSFDDRCGWVRVSANDGYGRPQHPGLFPTNQFSGRSEVLLVVDPDARDHHDVPIDDVDRVQATAETDLEDCVVEGGPRHHAQGGQRRVLEIRQADPAPT